MDGDAGRLVDHQHQPVAIEQPRPCFFRGHWMIASGRDDRGQGGKRASRTGEGSALPHPEEPAQAGVSKDEDDFGVRRERIGRLSGSGDDQPKTGLLRRLLGGQPQAAAAKATPAPEPQAPRQSWLARLRTGPVALLFGARARHRRYFRQAQARRRRARRPRGHSRSRPISGSPPRRASARRSARGRYDKTIDARRSEGDSRRRGRARAGPGRAAARGRSRRGSPSSFWSSASTARARRRPSASSRQNSPPKGAR